MLTRAGRLRQSHSKADAMHAPAAIIGALEGEPLRHVAAMLVDGDLTCFRLACAAFRAHSARPVKQTRSAFLRSVALAQLVWDQLPDFYVGLLQPAPYHHDGYVRPCSTCATMMLTVSWDNDVALIRRVLWRRSQLG